MDDKVYSFTQKIIAQVVDEQDKYLKDVIVKYAQEQSKKLGERIEILFIDKTVADEIISLGIMEYMKIKNND
jgi:hypothetical protein